ncbi:hypothetical protein [Burkholderia ubonensis]|uniref:hypothetical protein n=1 Tax=Burkholderia ubonensis TaxID=101571 RepID=UPI0012F9EF78|nr:hypothetical protein [Burkholderia ubonensis]
MFWESSSAKSRRFPWINLVFYRCDGALCKKRACTTPTGNWSARCASRQQQKETRDSLD